MDIKIGFVDADPRVLDKSTMMTGTRDVPVQIWKDCDVKRPTFLLDITAANVHANYCYVADWGAYYFLSEPVIMDGNRCTVTGTLDPLTTYAGGIKDLYGYLIRTADSARVNKLLRDDKQPKQANRHLRTLPFDKSPFAVNYGSDTYMVLTVVGGKHT